MTPELIVFWLLSILTVASAVMVVSSPHVVHAALWLVVTLGAVAGCFLVLTAEFVAWVQVLIYVGAVVVLLLFALMLTRSPSSTTGATSRNRPVAAVAGFSTFAVLAVVLTSGFRGIVLDLGGEDERLGGQAAPERIGDARSIGDAIFTHWVLAFEVLSVILLAALIGAIVVSGRVRERDRADVGGGS